MAVTKYIVFHLNDQKYSMKLTKINGIEYVYHVVPVPMGPACIKGIIHLRNEVIPVFSLKRLFGMPEEAAETQLLITETHGMKLAIEVDTVLGIVNVEEEDIKQIPMVVHRGDRIFRGCCKTDAAGIRSGGNRDQYRG